jgi:transposase
MLALRTARAKWERAQVEIQVHRDWLAAQEHAGEEEDQEALADHSQAEQARLLFDGGASKRAIARRLCVSTSTVARWVDPAQAERDRSRRRRGPSLSERRREIDARRERVKALRAEGLREQDIAVRLGISRTTVQTDLRHLRQSSRPQELIAA